MECSPPPFSEKKGPPLSEKKKHWMDVAHLQQESLSGSSGQSRSTDDLKFTETRPIDYRARLGEFEIIRNELRARARYLHERVQTQKLTAADEELQALNAALHFSPMVAERGGPAHQHPQQESTASQTSLAEFVSGGPAEIARVDAASSPIKNSRQASPIKKSPASTRPPDKQEQELVRLQKELETAQSELESQREEREAGLKSSEDLQNQLAAAQERLPLLERKCATLSETRATDKKKLKNFDLVDADRKRQIEKLQKELRKQEDIVKEKMEFDAEKKEFEKRKEKLNASKKAVEQMRLNYQQKIADTENAENDRREKYALEKKAGLVRFVVRDRMLNFVEERVRAAMVRRLLVGWRDRFRADKHEREVRELEKVAGVGVYWTRRRIKTNFSIFLCRSSYDRFFISRYNITDRFIIPGIREVHPRLGREGGCEVAGTAAEIRGDFGIGENGLGREGKGHGERNGGRYGMLCAGSFSFRR